MGYSKAIRGRDGSPNQVQEKGRMEQKPFSSYFSKKMSTAYLTPTPAREKRFSESNERKIKALFGSYWIIKMQCKKSHTHSNGSDF
jgi:hypothetical protein